LARDSPLLDLADTENNSEMKREVGERTLHPMAKVDDVLEMWQGSQNLHATQKESRTTMNQLTAPGYNLDTEEIVKASWSLFEYDGVAAMQLSERSPMPTALSPKDITGGQTQIVYVRQIRRIDPRHVESD
jgi:hypothetical protein